MWGKIALVIAVTMTTAAYGQSLPSDAIPAFLKSLDNASCSELPVGIRDWGYSMQTQRPTGGGLGGGADLQNALYYEGQGVLEIRFVSHVIGDIGRFQVVLKFPIDGTFIRKTGDKICFNGSDYSKATGTVARSENVKGGKTGWVGIIAYIQITGIGCLTPPPGMKKICANNPSRVSQFRVLFRQNPFGNNWQIMAWDVYRDDKFFSDRVIQQLSAD